MAEQRGCDNCNYQDPEHPELCEDAEDGQRQISPGNICENWMANIGMAPRDLPSPTTSAFISGLINELHDRVGKKAFGRVGLTFVIHEGMVSKYEWTDSTTVKPENGGAK